MTHRYTGSRKTDDVLARATIIYAALVEAGEATRDELTARVQKALGASAYGKSPADSLRRDLDWLGRLGFEVGLMPGHRYRLIKFNPRFPIPLTREQVETLAAVRRAFEDTLYSQAIESLVANLRPFLPATLRPLLDREPLLRLRTPLLDDVSPHERTMRLFRKAAQERRQLTFIYLSPTQAEPIRHTIEPEAIEERDGHVYFEGYHSDSNTVLRYRLDRVQSGSAEILPRMFPKGRRRQVHAVRYRLAPEIARFGATPRFAKHRETVAEDGWIEVTAETPDLFWAGKVLLKYGEKCVALKPPELAAEMKRVVEGMARNYGVK